MKNKIILVALPLIGFFSCHETISNYKENNEKIEISKKPIKIEITPFIINEVVLNDTNDVKTVGHGAVTNGKWHPTETNIGYSGTYTQMSAGQMQLLLRGLIHSKDPKVYLDIDSNRLSHSQIFTFANCCDSIVEFDDKGVEKGRRFICDSLSMYDGIKKIIFYESWDLNLENGTIEKEILGYTLCHNLYNNNIWRSKGRYQAIFHIFNSEATLKKAQKYFFIKTK